MLLSYIYLDFDVSNLVGMRTGLDACEWLLVSVRQGKEASNICRRGQSPSIICLCESGLVFVSTRGRNQNPLFL